MYKLSTVHKVATDWSQYIRLGEIQPYQIKAGYHILWDAPGFEDQAAEPFLVQNVKLLDAGNTDVQLQHPETREVFNTTIYEPVIALAQKKSCKFEPTMAAVNRLKPGDIIQARQHGERHAYKVIGRRPKDRFTYPSVLEYSVERLVTPKIRALDPQEDTLYLESYAYVKRYAHRDLI